MKFGFFNVADSGASGGSGSGIKKVADAATRLALTPANGDVVIQLDTDELYEYDITTTAWIKIGGGGFLPGSIIFAGADGGLSQDNAHLNYDDTNKVFHVNGALSVNNALANDTAGSAGVIQVSSNTTVNGSITTIGINGAAMGTVQAAAENDKTVAGMSFVVTRGDGTDDGILDNLTGASALIFANSGAAGVNGESIGYDHFYFGQKGETTNYYSFRGETVPAGTGTIVNYNGLYLNNQLDTTTYEGIRLVNSGTIAQDGHVLDYTNNHSIGNSFFVSSVNNSGSIGGGLTGYNFNNSGNVTGNAVGFEYNNSATVGGNSYGLHINNQPGGDVAGDYQPILIGNSGAIGGNLFGFYLNNAGVVTGDSKGIQVNETADSGSFLGLLIGKQANTTDPTKNMEGANIFLNGNSAQSITGMRIDLQNSVSTQNLEGLVISMQNATSGNSSVSISTDGGKLGINSKDVMLPAAFFQSGNSISTQTTTSADVTNTAYISNFLLSVLNINDNIAADGAGIGTNQVGFVGSVNIAAGKTVAELNGVVSGWQQSGGSGSVTNSASYLAVGNLGGAAVTVANQYGLRVKNGFSAGATNTWGVSVEDATTKNLFAGPIQTGITASRAVVTDASSFLTQSATTDTEIGYVSGVTSAIQTQLNGKQATGNYITALTGDVTASGPGSVAATIANLAVTNAKIANSTIDLTTKVSGVLPVANGGTNSSTSLNNNRVMKSSGGAIVEAAAITASRALISDANGIPTQSATTSTELAYLSGVTSPTGSGALVLGTAPTLSNPIVGTQATSDSSTKAASTAYVTTAIANAVAGVNPAVAVQAATTSAADTSGFTYNNGVAGVGATFTGTVNTAVTIDGYTFTAVGQRLLIKNDTQAPSGAFNGVYYLSQLQTGVLAPVFTRATDFNQASDINNTGAIPVINGTVNTTTTWVVSSSVTTVGTDAITFTEFTRNPADYLLKANNLSDVTTPNTAMNNISPLTTKGDLIAFSTVNARLAAGANATTLVADSTQALGLKYVTPIAALVVTNGTRQTGTSMSAGTSITPTAGQNYVQFVKGNGGAVTITATPPVSVTSMVVGQQLTIIGTDDTNTVTYTNSTALQIGGSCTLGKDQSLSLMYMGSDGTNAAWVEVGRST